MKIDVNALMSLLVLSSTVLGGWIAYLQIVKPQRKTNTAKCEELEARVEKNERQIKTLRDKLNELVRRLKEKSSFN